MNPSRKQQRGVCAVERRLEATGGDKPSEALAEHSRQPAVEGLTACPCCGAEDYRDEKGAKASFAYVMPRHEGFHLFCQRCGVDFSVREKVRQYGPEYSEHQISLYQVEEVVSYVADVPPSTSEKLTPALLLKSIASFVMGCHDKCDSAILGRLKSAGLPSDPMAFAKVKLVHSR